MKEGKYILGIDRAVEGGDMTSVVVRRKDGEVRVLSPEDYVLERNNITLKVNLDELFADSLKDPQG